MVSGAHQHIRPCSRLVDDERSRARTSACLLTTPRPLSVLPGAAEGLREECASGVCPGGKRQRSPCPIEQCSGLGRSWSGPERRRNVALMQAVSSRDECIHGLDPATCSICLTAARSVGRKHPTPVRQPQATGLIARCSSCGLALSDEEERDVECPRCAAISARRQRREQRLEMAAPRVAWTLRFSLKEW